MNFAFPAAWGWLGLALPIILFYLIRQRLRTKPVSSLLFWQQVAPKVHNTPLWRKLRRWFSLLLQLLLLGLLTAALTRPLWPGQSQAVESIIVVVDPSVTMTAMEGATTRWELAMQEVEQRVRKMRFFDSMCLVAAEDSPRVLAPWTSRKGELREALQKMQPRGNVPDLRPALALARNLARTRPGSRIELFTDGVWSVLPAAEELVGVKIHFVGKPGDNSGLTLFSARRSLAVPGEYQLALELEQNQVGVVKGELEVLRDGRLMDVVQLDLQPGKPWQKAWADLSGSAARFETRWKDAGIDLLARDNSALAELGEVKPIRVQLVSPPSAFLEVALAAQPLVEIKRVWPVAELEAGGNYDLSIFNGAVPPQGFAGRAVLLIHPEESGFWGERRGTLEKPLVSDVPLEEGLLRFVDFTSVQLRAAIEFKPVAGAEVYVESFGQPLVFGQWENEPRWLVLAFDLDDSDFVFRTAFPILLGNVIQSLRPEEVGKTEPLPGTVATQLKRTAPEGLEAPDGRAVSFLGWWAMLPFWWWFVLAGLIWMVAEWFLYSRRITE